MQELKAFKGNVREKGLTLLPVRLSGNMCGNGTLDTCDDRWVWYDITSLFSGWKSSPSKPIMELSSILLMELVGKRRNG